ncbi:hypothetical protein [Streptomyces sp. NPDC004065]|uniref:hypothetical protein n=1 Tax=Streptomyces sp. NPDC004065 TaxID=3364689 RepID=UPI00384D4389
MNEFLRCFGAQAAAELERWQNSRRRITFAKELTGGSGARLAFVYHQGDADHPQQKLLLKLCADEEGSVDEPRDHEAAWQSGPEYHRGGSAFDFPRRRLIRQVYPALKVGTTTWLMFLGVALDKRGRYPLSPLSTVPSGTGKAQVAAAVIRSIFEEWNPDHKANQELAAHTFLQQALGHRAAPDSRLARSCRQLLGSAVHDPNVQLPGWPSPLPNPTPLANPSPLAGLKPPTVALGRAHYDLHPGNIMVADQPALEPDSFRLIDLSRFTEEGLLLRDPVHLMLCLVCDYLPDLSEQARDQLRALLLDLDGDGTGLDVDRVPAGLISTVRLLRSATESWRRRRDYPHPDWHPQYLLALQACALMFLTRSEAPEDQRWFLRLAASACAAFRPMAEPFTPHPSAQAPPPGRAASRPAVPDEDADLLPSALRAELLRHRSKLRHLRTRCADPRFDTVLTDNLRAVVNRCTRLAALAQDGDPTEAAAVLHQQCTTVLQAAETLRAAHDRSDDHAARTAARTAFVTALARLLDSPGRGAAHPADPRVKAEEELPVQAGRNNDATPRTPPEPPMAQVLPFPHTPRTSGAAVELSSLLRDIDRLPADASGPRLVFLGRRICARAARLANSLTGLDTTLLRNQLEESAELMTRFDATTPPAEIHHLLRLAGQRLRTYGREVWPDEVD